MFHTQHQREFIRIFVFFLSRLIHLSYCFSLHSLSPAVGALYVRKFFNEKSKEHAQQIVENVKSSFIDMLYKVEWMDESTRNKAVDKAKALVPHIAFPNELTNKTTLENFYKLLTMNENEYFMNALRLNKFRTEYALRQLYEPVNKSDWLAHATPAMTNAFYSALENSIRMCLYWNQTMVHLWYKFHLHFLLCIILQNFQRAYCKERFSQTNGQTI